MFLSLFCISIPIRICFLNIPCIVFSFMTWVKVTCGLRISLRRIKVCFIINRVYDRYNVWIVNKRSMILDKWSKYLLYFCNDKRISIWDAVLLEKGYLAKWPSLPSAENMYVCRTAYNHQDKKIGNLDILLWILE